MSSDKQRLKLRTTIVNLDNILIHLKNNTKMKEKMKSNRRNYEILEHGRFFAIKVRR